MNKLTNQQQQQPICMVCGETSSTGYHCGAVTCEACKKFFQRNYDGEYKQFRCIRGTQNCAITMSTRTSCPFCRYKKCEQVGMKANEKAPSQAVAFKKIPCSVCGDSSSGLHFGVITCEGCKGFFRRNAKSSEKFLCIANNICEINVPNRNVCKSCRLNKCIEVGMNLKNSKIGRQTNLFKQNLISTIDKNDQQMNSDDIIQMKTDTCYLPDIEDSLDVNTKMYIKTIYEAYKECFENNNHYAYTGYFPIQYQEHKYVFDYLFNNINNIYAFLYKISDTFKNMNQTDKYKVICNAIHPIRLLQMAYNSNNNSNYFNTDIQTYERLIRCFPIFASSIEFLNKIKDFIKSLKLDPKEFALYVALLSFSSGGHKFSIIKQSYSLNLEITKALTAYMKLRRNEDESAELLIYYGTNFEKINIILQQGVYESFKEIEFCLQSDTVLHKVIYSTFEINE